MKSYRPPARSRAAPDTLCQKCLNRGHYSYECSAKAQERPYAARPSRTQQLLNPKLVPKLNNDVPNDLLQKKGVADEELAKKKHERSRKRSRDSRNGHLPRKRSRSMSSRSSSVSTISTNVSRSPSPKRNQRPRHSSPSPARTHPRPKVGKPSSGKRRRSMSSSSSDSHYSRISDGMKEARACDRNTRRRMSSFSPSARGRRRVRESMHDEMDESPIRSISPRRKRSRTRSRSPRRWKDEKGTALHQSRPRSRSPYANGSHTTAGSNNNSQNRGGFDRRRSPAPKRERSLSPFSKRVALTRAMNQGPAIASGNPPPWR